MDTSEPRRRYAERIEHAAEEQRQGHRDFSDRSRPAEERRAALRRVAALRGQDEVAEAVEDILNEEEEPALRASALRAIGIEVGKRQDLIDMAIGLFRDGAQPAEVRQTALRVLQQSSFRAATFNPKLPEYLDALRTVAEDSDASLREQALEILAQRKDEYCQRRLLEGLEDPSRALVSPEKAIQLLGYDIHAEHYPILRDMVQNPPSPEAKEEAVRLLAGDPASKGLLEDLLSNRDETREVRNASAAALQSMDPEEFERQAREIALAEDEYDDIRATAINALTLFGDQEALDQDAELIGRVEQLREEAPSEEVERSADRFLRKQRRRRERRDRSDGPPGV
jgi:HEAT repeat protein